MSLINQPSSLPIRKIAFGGVSGGVMATLIFLLRQFGIIVPDEVSAAMQSLIEALPVVVMFIVSYFTKSRAGEV